MSGSRTLTTSLAWAGDGATHVRDLMMRLGDDAFPAPSGLPGWSRAHLLTHVARNAEALTRVLVGARTGVPTPAYTSDEQRDADIAAGATRSPAEIRDDVVATSDQLAAVVRHLPDKAWSAVVDVRGRSMPATEVAWLRAVEVWVHAIDLDVGATFADLPRPMLTDLLSEITAGMAARPGGPALRVVADDLPDGVWRMGADGEVQEIGGSAVQLAAWLTGRSNGKRLRRDKRKLPVLPPWR